MDRTKIDSYEITSYTLALQPNYDPEYQTLAFEDGCAYLVRQSILQIIKYSCLINGSSLSGRREYSEYVTNKKYKLPILLSEVCGIVAMPTHSSEHVECSWIMANHVERLRPRYKNGKQKGTLILFNNGATIPVDVPHSLMKSQHRLSLSCLGHHLIQSRRK